MKTDNIIMEIILKTEEAIRITDDLMEEKSEKIAHLDREFENSRSQCFGFGPHSPGSGSDQN